MIALVDTCVWSLALRRSEKHLNLRETHTLKFLKEAILEGRAQMLGVIRQELLSGIRHKEQFEATVAATRSFADISLEIADYEEAAVASNHCRAVGIAGSPVDFLLCAVAMRRSWAILTTDKDFARYQKQLPITLMSP